MAERRNAGIKAPPTKACRHRHLSQQQRLPVSRALGAARTEFFDAWVDIREVQTTNGNEL